VKIIWLSLTQVTIYRPRFNHPVSEVKKLKQPSGHRDSGTV